MNKIFFFSILFLFSFLGYAQIQNSNKNQPVNTNASLRIIDPGNNQTWYRDLDGDGWGNPDDEYEGARIPGYVSNAQDLDDNNQYITNIPPKTFYQDSDGDGYGNPNATKYYSLKPTGYVNNSLDCNDSDVTLTPYTIWYRDADGDGYGVSGPTLAQCTQPAGYVRNTSDYDDTTGNITNIAPQIFYRDADGDTFGASGSIAYYSVKPEGYVTNSLDCNDGDMNLNPNTVWYRDADGDSYGVIGRKVIQCIQPEGYVLNTSDYDDTTLNITNIAPQTFYRDADGDTFGAFGTTVYYSVKPEGYVTNSLDCNDGDVNLNPNTVWYRDADGDGYGVSSTTVVQCAQPSGYVRNTIDYDDTTGNITNIAPQIFYRDADGDTFGTSGTTVYYSVKPEGYVLNSLDCNDGDVTLNPNTVWYLDADGDGYGVSSATVVQCTQPAGYVRNTSDYDDTTGNITNIAPQTFYRDADGDSFGTSGTTVYYSVKPEGYVANSLDCNDGDVTLNPNTLWYRDADEDGYGASSPAVAQCTQPAGYVRNTSDYDDTTGNITNIAPQTFYRDADGDTFGTSGSTVYYSVKPEGYVTNSLDCNDGDVTLNPNTVWYRDADGDGYGASSPTVAQCTQPAGYVRNTSDYDDTTGNITNIAPQTFYRDADGDTFGTSGTTVYYSVRPEGYVTNSLDCNDGDVTLNPNTVWYLDADGDGYGVSSATVAQCTQPAGYVQNTSDYDDTTGNITNIAPQTFYRDADGDTFGTSGTTVYYSVKPEGYVTNSLDCNDGDVTLNPNTVWYLDADGDGYGVSSATVAQCAQPAGYVRNTSDYDDTTGNITNIAPQTFYRDADNDTFGSPSVTVFYSMKQTGYVTNNTDCNDADETINPNTKWYLDNDLDGLGDPSNYVQQCNAPTGNYVRDNTDNCPLLNGSSPDCSSIIKPPLDHNYVINNIYKEASSSVIDHPTADQVQSSITYFDGLGRPMQQIANRQSSSGKDIITNISYDNFGRQIQEYLPYAANSTNMVFEANAAANTVTFYSTEKYENTANPFSQKKLESSPLNRVLKQAAPGTPWAMDSGQEIKLDYQTNTDSEVRLFKATATWTAVSGLFEISFSDEGNYNANQLYKNITYDENTAANPTETLGSTVEFKNKEGQVVLKRTYESGIKHDTYYVYDIYGNLTYVIPPKADATISDEVLEGLCYQYKYDYRNRLVEKKLPGKQWEFIVYDKLDRPVATGPATSPFKDDTAIGWLITKYDALSRPVYTGWLNQSSNSTIRNSLQTEQNNAALLFEQKQTSGSIDNISINYSNANAPTNFKLLTVNYYDDYHFANSPAVPATIEGEPVLANTKGLQTGSWVRIATTPTATLAETSATFYDAKSRPIRSYLQNHLGGYTITDSKLDFRGKTLYTFTKHKRSSANAELTIKEEFTYSAQDRLLTHTHQINGGAVELMASNTYDDLGQLIVKSVGNNAGNPLQRVNFDYNIRGWLRAINKTENLQEDTDPIDLFAFKINYNTPQNNIPGVKALYNGNISETRWKAVSDLALRSYGYKYDNLNRLTAAVYGKPEEAIPGSGAYNESLSYDKNGNIKFLQRNGTSDAPSIVFQIDDLKYEYLNENSNQLKKVTDSPAGNDNEGFKDGNKTGDDFDYDVNGNMISDKNKNIMLITYNHLNLPKKITFGTGNTIEYIYNAAGQKLEKIVTDNGVVTNTNYLGGFQYKDNVLEFFPSAEGYVNNTAGMLSYVFQYKDHLGNIRLSYKKNAQNVLEIIEENNYYPFGLMHKGYNTESETSNKYKYNGKELQDELGLNMYDYGARNYDPALGRWMNIDPLAEISRRFSPYTYANNNPVYFIDPDGMIVINGDQAARDEAKKNQEAAQANFDSKSSGYDRKTASKEERKAYNNAESDLNKANRTYDRADSKYQHTQKSIDNFKTVDPTNFAIADNLTYTNKAGETKNLDIVVTTANASDFGGGKTGIAKPDTNGNIPTDKIYTTIGQSVGITSNVLGHEFGHGVSIAADPLGYYNQMVSNPDQNCQDSSNRSSTLSKNAVDWQESYDMKYKAYIQALKKK